MIWDTVKEAKAFATMTDGMKYFLGAVGIATLFIGGIGVMNVMLVAVRERTREIGVRKALGATRRSIVRMFFLETMIVVFLSGGVGLAIGYGFCALVNLLPMPMYFAGLLPTWSSGLLAFGLLGMGGATVVVIRQIELSDVASERSAALQASIERMRALPFDSVVNKSDSIGLYEVYWNVTSGNQWKSVDIITTGPGLKMSPGGFPILARSVPDTFTYRVIRP